MTVQLAVVRNALAAIGEPRDVEGGLRVPTATLLPGGGAVSVLVAEEGAGRFVVSDGGAGRAAMLDAGVQGVRRQDRADAAELAGKFGLEVDGDEFVARGVAVDQLASAVAFVADASRAWAESVIRREVRRHERDLTETVRARLERVFAPSSVIREAQVLGASNTQHRFDFMVALNGGRSALFEIVSPAPTSIAAMHLKFSDVRIAHEDWPREAVIEDPNAWSAESVSLISQVASHVRPTGVEWTDLAFLVA